MDPPAALPFAFRDVAAEVGLVFTHQPGATGECFPPEITGPGGALLDYDGDGDLDVYLLQGGWLGADGASKPNAGNQLFRNELISDGGHGELRFVNVTDGSGAGDTGYAQGVATGDYDNDGRVDIYVTNYGPDVLLHNDGNGRFTDTTAAAGLGDPRWNTSASFVDYDLDGFLDLAVLAYASISLGANIRCQTAEGVRDYCAPNNFPPIPPRLYRNRGDGTFEDVSVASGIQGTYGHGLGVVAVDIDENGWPDLYIANDGDANQLWMNEGGRFRDTALLNGVAFNQAGAAEASMGVAVIDFDADGDRDILLTHLIGETNTLYENLGGGMFSDSTARFRMGSASLPFTGFGVEWIDVDHDADLDLLVANGSVTIDPAATRSDFPYDQPNQLMLRGSDGNLIDRTRDAGPGLQRSEVSRGLAVGDVDNDGDEDVLITNDNGPVRLLLNDLKSDSSWIEVAVKQGPSGRDAIGATVRLTTSDGTVRIRDVRTDGSYCSARDPRVHFAWPGSLEAETLEVHGLDGASQSLREIPTGRVVTITLTPRKGRS